MMIRKSTVGSALAAAGTLACGVTLWTASRSQSVSKPDTPLKVAMVLDCITQPRFQDDLKNFGMSRLLPAANGHLQAGRLSLPTQKDKDLYKTAEDSHRDFVIGFYHCAHIPGQDFSRPGSSPRSGSSGTRSTKATSHPAMIGTPGQESDMVSQVCNNLRHLSHTTGFNTAQANLYSEMGKASHKALPTLLKGKGAQQDSGDWIIVMQPVRAMKTTCLKCHEGAKQGDTLGVLTYAVSKKTFADAGPAVGANPVRQGKGGF